MLITPGPGRQVCAVWLQEPAPAFRGPPGLILEHMSSHTQSLGEAELGWAGTAQGFCARPPHSL